MSQETLGRRISTQASEPGIGTIARALGWPKKRVRAASAELDAKFEAMRAENPGVQVIAEAMQKGPVDEDWAVQVLRAGKAKPPKRSFLNSN